MLYTTTVGALYHAPALHEHTCTWLKQPGGASVLHLKCFNSLQVINHTGHLGLYSIYPWQSHFNEILCFVCVFCCWAGRLQWISKGLIIAALQLWNISHSHPIWVFHEYTASAEEDHVMMLSTQPYLPSGSMFTYVTFYSVFQHSHPYSTCSLLAVLRILAITGGSFYS